MFNLKLKKLIEKENLCLFCKYNHYMCEMPKEFKDDETKEDCDEFNLLSIISIMVTEMDKL